MENLINEKWSEIHALRQYLNDTDYKVIKAYETGYVITPEELQARENARSRISTLQVEISQLEKQMQQAEEGTEITPETLRSEVVINGNEITTTWYNEAGEVVKTETETKQQPVTERVETIETIIL